MCQKFTAEHVKLEFLYSDDSTLVVPASDCKVEMLWLTDNVNYPRTVSDVVDGNHTIEYALGHLERLNIAR